jgi:hypothetical protein
MAQARSPLQRAQLQLHSNAQEPSCFDRAALAIAPSDAPHREAYCARCTRLGDQSHSAHTLALNTALADSTHSNSLHSNAQVLSYFDRAALAIAPSDAPHREASCARCTRLGEQSHSARTLALNTALDQTAFCAHQCTSTRGGRVLLTVHSCRLHRLMHRIVKHFALRAHVWASDRTPIAR